MTNQLSGTGRKSISEKHENFLEIEEGFDAFDVRIDGVPVWERIRFSVHQNLLFPEQNEPSETSGVDSIVEKIGPLGLLLRNIFIRNPFACGEHDVLFFGHSRRKQLEDGYWWDIYCDPVHRQLDIDYIHFEGPFNDNHRTPARTERLRYLDLIKFSASIQRNLGLVDVTIPFSQRRTLRSIGQEIARQFSVDISIVELARRELSIRRSLKWLYVELLKRANPEIAVLVTSYARETFIEACQELDITVVELQHGVIHEYHCGYSYPGYRTKEAFPDYLFTFGEFWNDAVAFPVQQNRIIEVGYPYLEMQSDRYDDVASHAQVLFISQQMIGKSLSKMAVDAADRIEEDVVYKLHPEMMENWKSRYPWLRDSAVTVVGDDGPPLYELFATSTVQVGVGSTALYEGLNFDLPTYLVSLPGIEYVRPLLDGGYATAVGSADELVDAVNSEAQPSVDSNRFFSDDAVNNIETHLQRIRSGVIDE